jgi:hypothetical protein
LSGGGWGSFCRGRGDRLGGLHGGGFSSAEQWFLGVRVAYNQQAQPGGQENGAFHPNILVCAGADRLLTNRKLPVCSSKVSKPDLRKKPKRFTPTARLAWFVQITVVLEEGISPWVGE